jgi:hypothetical protein
MPSLWRGFPLIHSSFLVFEQAFVFENFVDIVVLGVVDKFVSVADNFVLGVLSFYHGKMIYLHCLILSYFFLLLLAFFKLLKL